MAEIWLPEMHFAAPWDGEVLTFFDGRSAPRNDGCARQIVP